MKILYLPGPMALLRSLKSRAWLHWTVVMLVFSITGTVSVVFSRFFLYSILNLEGGVWSGPWSYRIAYLILIPPFYSVTLVMVGTLFGKHRYFRGRVLRMWGLLLKPIYRRRTIIPGQAPDSAYHSPRSGKPTSGEMDSGITHS